MAVMGDASAEVWAEELRRTGRVVFPQRPRAIAFRVVLFVLPCVMAAKTFPDMRAEGGFARSLGFLLVSLVIAGLGHLVWQASTRRPVLTVDREGIRFGRKFRPWTEIGAIGIPHGHGFAQPSRSSRPTCGPKTSPSVRTTSGTSSPSPTGWRKYSRNNAAWPQASGWGTHDRNGRRAARRLDGRVATPRAGGFPGATASCADSARVRRRSGLPQPAALVRRVAGGRRDAAPLRSDQHVALGRFRRPLRLAARLRAPSRDRRRRGGFASAERGSCPGPSSAPSASRAARRPS